MRRSESRVTFVAPLLLLVAVGTGVEFARHCPSCIDRGRVNRDCEWSGDAAFPVDANNPAQREHLVADAQLAEELSIRYGDAEFDRRYGYEAHGGLIDHGRVVRGCMARLVAAIERNHGVTDEQIAAARGEHNPRFDTAAAVSFLPLYALAALVVSRRLRRRVSAESAAVRLAALAATSAAASLLAMPVGQLWLAVWAAVRVGNGHMSSFRSATRTDWTHHHVGAIFLGGVLMFWLLERGGRRLAVQQAAAAAAMAACTMVAAMFVEVFVQRAAGYAIVAAALVGCYSLARAAARVGDVEVPQGLTLR